jgi:DNA-binding response OmpR family regulator
VIDADADRARRVLEAAAAQGLPTAVAPTLDAARRVIDTARPEAVVVDAAAGDEGDDLAAFLSDLAEARPAAAVVVLVDQANAVERVQAARSGAWVVLQKPAPPDAVVQAVSRMLARRRSGGTVLAVDDDRTFLVLVHEVLTAEGFAVESLDDAAGLWPALEAVEPDLLLLDNDMPGLDGVSLCQALRADERWARLPVVFLSGSRSPEAVRAMYAAGADDFVPKPLSIDDLVTRIDNRIRRSRAQSERPDVVLATGLPSEQAFLGDAARLLGLARQGARPAVLAVAQLEPPTPSAVAAFGRRLRQAAAPEDAVGTWAGGRVAALLYGLTAAEAQDRLGRVLRAARATGTDAAPAVAVGIAATPDGGADLGSLGPAAEAALGQAGAVGRDAIVVQELPGRGPTEVVDVLLVDDDEALGALVEHALAGRGWSVRWLRDGAEAVELLDTPGVLARAVLLDVGLPGLDGLSVLRHLGRRGRLATTRVVMLTVRANEVEVLEALDLGAFDHVAKPFSLSVLIHRVRRAVEG